MSPAVPCILRHNPQQSLFRVPDAACGIIKSVGDDVSLMRVSDRDDVRYLIFDRPEKKNPFTVETSEQIVEAVENCDPDEQSVIVITGEGEAFSAGADMEAVSDPSNSARETYERYSRGGEFVDALLSAPVPTIAKINGDAAGVGLSIVALCDFAYAVEDAKLSAAFVKIGLAPDGGATVFLERHVGLRTALDLALTGRAISATEAEEMGLLNEVVPADSLDEAVGEQIDQLRPLSTDAIVGTRQAFHENAGRHWRQGVDYEMQIQAQLSDTEAHRDAVEAFLERT